ncbi:phosphoenolpyruvate--protein phosphotransferase [Pseudogracilibacillus auburnensis]|uniref:phosphoenolpyruvate--protein phosphotransferase n=1 Tax=Pseudogracilibacillus auburnensis TaxID=1494959 RepID=UPI001A9753DB|nr:phosphoenolpyruvate--protein phosphotransferase [Pseudogracilibacillus auburnensis]MBO1002001.1 phosphoenolpyruvate--protein phosphotransferase [Pseudogracilibacillus auburnensis]
MRNKIKGISASKGIAIASPYLLKSPDLSFEKREIDDEEKELKRFHGAINQSKVDLSSIQKKVSVEEAKIFDAHLLLLEDPELISAIETKIKDEKSNAEAALDEVMTTYIDMFEALDDEYLKERAADIKDIMKRIMAHLLNKWLPDLSLIKDEVIIVAKDLTPSETAQLDIRYVKGFVTDIGGKTSHSAIMARTMGIPAVVGTSLASEHIGENDLVIIDGEQGEVYINPDSETVKSYEKRRDEDKQHKETLKQYIDLPTELKDGHTVKLNANIGSPSDVKQALENGAEGIGLYRTEFLYMESHQAPTEEEQFEAYKTVLEQMGDRPVTVRTLDIGGDKELSYLQLPKEENPFLGLRAIRYTLKEKELFATQLRALLRASVYGTLKIMFPMISTIEEFIMAKNMLLAEKQKLVVEGISVSDNIDVGIMVETPSVIMLMEQFAQIADFFSIGTNDLTQYTFACDRMNENVSYLYQSHNPAIFTMIAKVAQAAKKYGKKVSVCGELASDDVAQAVLVGLGVEELSMNAPSILGSRFSLINHVKEDLEILALEVTKMKTQEELMKQVNKFLTQITV